MLKLEGYVVGAFFDGKLKGFASVEPVIFGATAKYMDLSNIHISQDMRRQGIGKELAEKEPCDCQLECVL